jgi:putative transposase
MNRGARRAPIFRDESDCTLFLELLSAIPERFGCEVHGYALMPNHFHLMIESMRGELSRAIGFLTSRFAVRVNQRERWDGPLFRGRFRNRVVWHEQHWMHLLAYLHLNPVRARLVVRPEQADWTSHRYYTGKKRAPDWLSIGELLSAFGGKRGYQRYLSGVQTKRDEAPEAFDAVLFGRGRTISADDVPKHMPRLPKSPSPRKALMNVARAAGVKVASLKETQRGRTGNPARIVGAWWLVQTCGLTTVEAGKLLEMRPADVSKAVGKVGARRNGDNPIGRLVLALER